MSKSLKVSKHKVTHPLHDALACPPFLVSHDEPCSSSGLGQRQVSRSMSPNMREQQLKMSELGMGMHGLIECDFLYTAGATLISTMADYGRMYGMSSYEL